MSYQVLARKWRPQNFTEMVGQEHVLRALINALDSDRLHHAYLFTGTRGVGKTTIARILAKCLNCETGVTSKPCGECSSCKEIVAGNFVDLIEVDAASRTKVEDTRELLDNVQYAPTRGRFKVYLIDEVHMLTGHSFNALLKTLEEPPPHVKFLFATTDPQKLPVTILSRCLQFNLKRMPVDMISGHLNYLLEQEKIPFEQPSLKLIARAADGSMRDALSLLDQSIAFSGQNLKEADVREMLGTISHEPLLALLESINKQDGAGLLQQVEDLSGVTPDFEAATDALISLLHQLAVLQVVPDADENDDSLIEFAKNISKEDVQLYYQIALNGRRDLSLSPDPRSGFEMLLLRMMSFSPLREGMKINSPIKNEAIASAIEPTEKESLDNKKKRSDLIEDNIRIKPDSPSVDSKQEGKALDQSAEQSHPDEPPPWVIEVIDNSVKGSSDKNISAQNGLNVGGCASTDQNEAKAVKITKNIEPNDNKTETVQVKADTVSKVEEVRVKKLSLSSADSVKNTNNTNPEWHDVIPQLSLSGRAAELIKHCLLESNDNGIVSLRLEGSNQGLLSDSVKTEIESALDKYYGKNIKLNLSLQASPDEGETPAQRGTRETKELQIQAEKNIGTDPFVIELQNRFGAQIVPGSVIPK